MSDTIAICSCPELQEQLFDNFDVCDKTKISPLHETSLIQYLVSDVNAGDLQQKVSPGRGKLRQVDLLYTPRILPSDFSSTPAKVCVSTNTDGCLSETYQIDDVGFQIDKKFDLVEMRDMCKDNALWFAERIQALMSGAIRKMDADVATDLATLTGGFGNGEETVNANNEKTVASRKANGDPDENFFVDVEFAAKNAGYCVNPVVFGYHEAWKAFRRSESGCCADSGVNLAEVMQKAGLAFFPNSNVHSTFLNGLEQHFIMMEPGSVQLLFWNEFMGEKGINVLDDDAYKQTVLFDPLTSIPFDFQLTNTCGVISVNLKLAYQAVGLPSDMFHPGDHHEGVTGVNEFLISNP